MSKEIQLLIAQRDAWRKVAGELYDELRVRGVSESVSRDGAGCIEHFESMEDWASNEYL